MTKPLLGILLFAAVLALSVVTPELDKDTMTAGLVAVIPFRLHGAMIAVELAIDNSRPLTFLFDTGAGGAILNARTAAELGVIGEGAVEREGATGSAPVAFSKKHTVSAGVSRLRNVTLGITELDRIERRLGLRIDGIIGWPILSRYAVGVNYDRMEIELYDARRFDYDLGGTSYDIAVNGTSLFVDAAVVVGESTSLSGRVLLDTGFGGTISFNTPFAIENGLLNLLDARRNREVRGFDAGSAQSYAVVLPNLRIGGHEFADVPASIAVAEAGALSWPGIMGILGNGVLKRFNLFLDVEDRRIFLEPSRLHGEPFEADGSGLELVMDEELERVLVDRVQPGTPADEAGLAPGDEILSIDGSSVATLGLPQIRTMLSRIGATVDILVEREGVQARYLLTLVTLFG